MDHTQLKQIITGTVGSIEMTEGFLLGAGMLMEIPIAMVLLSRILKYKSNRITNIIAAAIKTLAMISSIFAGTGPTLYYLFFGSIEIACTVFIIWYAWTWKNPKLRLAKGNS